MNNIVKTEIITEVREYNKENKLIHYKRTGEYSEEFWNEYDDNGNIIHHKSTTGEESWSKYDDKNRLIYDKNTFTGYEEHFKYHDDGTYDVEMINSKGDKTVLENLKSRK